jgi:hypothetical protein
VFIDFIHVCGYLGKAAAALHPRDPQAAREWADGQKLRVLHGRAKAVAATLASAATEARAKNSRPGLTDLDKAVTYPLRPRQHPRPRTHRMTGTTRNVTPLRKTHPACEPVPLTADWWASGFRPTADGPRAARDVPRTAGLGMTSSPA